MSRNRWIGVALVLILLWATRFVVDPGSKDGPSDPVAEKESGDRAFAEESWWLAGRHYRAAFALEDPRDTERVPHRAFLAHQAGTTYARVVTAGAPTVTHAERGDAKTLAVLWMDEALRLDPARGWLHYERALMLDRAPDPLREPSAAREAYMTFLRWVEDPGAAGAEKPPTDHPVVGAVRARIDALSG